MKLIKTFKTEIIVGLLFILFGYLMTAFVMWDIIWILGVGDWAMISRIGLVIFSITYILLAAFLVTDIDEILTDES